MGRASGWRNFLTRISAWESIPTSTTWRRILRFSMTGRTPSTPTHCSRRVAYTPTARFVTNASPVRQRAIEQALYYAVKHNDTGYNVYVTVNVLKPNTTQTATDDDVEVTIFHFLDADGVDDPDLISERSQGFKPTFTTLTGTIPQPRSQVYWRMSHPITDMVKWRTTQAALAQHFGTDNTVKNPSRVLRLAGTISHPPERKRKRGYIVEVTALDRTDNGEVCRSPSPLPFPTQSQPVSRQSRSAISRSQTTGMANCHSASSKRLYRPSRRSPAKDSETFGSTSRKRAATPTLTASLCSTSGNVSPIATRSPTARCGPR